MNKAGTEQLKMIDACVEAHEWSKGVKDLKTAWATCPRSDWMIWALHRIDFKDERKFRLCACQCVRETPLADGRTLWDLLTDERSRNAVEVAERFAEGKATDDERSAAYAYAYAAAYDAAAAAAIAATITADDAAYAYAIGAAAAALAAAYAAAVEAAAYADDADAARKTAQEWQADLLRQWISWDEVAKAIKVYKIARKA